LTCFGVLVQCEGEVDDGVDEDGEAAGLKVAELDDRAHAGDLEQQASSPGESRIMNSTSPMNTGP
jgi:hypothetical protein